MEALRDEGSHSEHGRWIPGQEGSPGDTVGPLRGESLTVSMGGSGRMGIVPGEQGVSPENKREISGDGRIIRMESVMREWSLGRKALTLRLSGAQTQTPGSVGAWSSVHSLVGVGAKGQQELHGTAVAQQR